MPSKPLFRLCGAVPLALCIGVPNALAQAVPGGTLDPLVIPKYVNDLPIPPVLYDDLGNAMDIEVALRQFDQRVLPASGCAAASAAQVAAGGPAIACDGDAFPATTLWGYGNPADPSTFSNPAYTIEVTKDTETRVKWVNELIADPVTCRASADPATDPACNYLSHIITDANGDPLIDQTLHWAAPNQDCADGIPRTDCRGASPAVYDGPIPLVMHVHGAHVGPTSDGYPEAWWLPGANNIPTGYATQGTFFADPGGAAAPGASTFVYSNDQPTTTLWYHDHSLGMTRLNVYASAAGFWLIRDGQDGDTGLVAGTLPGPAPQAGQDPNGDPAVRAAIREIPLAIQPKSFNIDGSQFYPADRAFFEGLGDGQVFAANTDVAMPFLPNTTSDIAPVWNPEAFFNTMVVNGTTWPKLHVAPERYRLRVLNAADSRFLNLSLQIVNPGGLLDGRELPIYQIGAEQSLLPQVVSLSTGFATPLPGDGRDVCPQNIVDLTALFPRLRNLFERICVFPVAGTFAEQALLVGPAERADVIVDFNILRALPDGARVRLINTAPDAPFGGFPDVPADAATTGQVMEFVLDRSQSSGLFDPSTPPRQLVLDANPGGVPKLGPSAVTQDLALLEEESGLLCVDIDAVTGAITLVPGSTPPLCAGGGVPFAPKAAVLGTNGSGGGIAQLWDDPIAQNPALNDIETWELWNLSADAHPIHLHLVKFEVIDREIIGGAVRPAEPWEAGWKDTVIAYPGEVTRIKARFDIAGLYVWHCHILSHEDNEMMVPYCVGTPGVDCPAELF